MTSDFYLKKLRFQDQSKLFNEPMKYIQSRNIIINDDDNNHH